MHTHTPAPDTAAAGPEPALLDLPAAVPACSPAAEAARPRLREVNRAQLQWRPLDLEAALPEDHRARIVWEYVEGLDLTPLYERILAVEGHAGRAATDPKILFALWLMATIEGVGSARALERLCDEHLAYQWLCGGVSVNYHTLADFRTAHVEVLDALLTRSVASLLAEQLVELHRVAIDGMRVRASAGAASFRRRPRLERCLVEAEAHVQALRAEVAADPAATTQRQRAARARAAHERRARVAHALAQWPAAAAKKPSAKQAETRVSTTDPEARVMKMADGGFRPAYNVQFATTTASQVIVGVDVDNEGSDNGHLVPMVDQLTARHGQPPAEVLADGGFVKLEALEAVSATTCVYAPVPAPKDPTRDPHVPLPGDSPPIAAWRQRMGTPEAQAIYTHRAATAECVNAQVRNRGLWQFLVRGLAKVRAVALWHALAHNLRRAVALRAPAVAGP